MGVGVGAYRFHLGVEMMGVRVEVVRLPAVENDQAVEQAERILEAVCRRVLLQRLAERARTRPRG
jgi:hypothetical protein